jgi:RNA polymerase sigma-70 factor (ECF subfamily)
MTNPELDTLWLHDRVGRVRVGDRDAADELIRAVSLRLERLARRMLRDFPAVRASADTGDVLQGALLRLVNALRDLRPDSTRDFVNLAALQVRRELLDLARHFAARGQGRHLADPGTADFGAADPDSPADLELWSRFHEAVEGLPAEERETVGLLFYHGYTRAQAALLLGVSERTVYRWWDSACLRLNERLGGHLPTA